MTFVYDVETEIFKNIGELHSYIILDIEGKNMQVEDVLCLNEVAASKMLANTLEFTGQHTLLEVSAIDTAFGEDKAIISFYPAKLTSTHNGKVLREGKERKKDAKVL